MVPVYTVNLVVPQLIACGKYIRPSLGVSIDADINRALTKQLGIEGVLLLKVEPGSATAGTPMPMPQLPGGVGEALVAHPERKRPLPAEALYRDGTTHVIFDALDFIARLAALVPKLRVNLTRFHGVFTPNSEQRA